MSRDTLKVGDAYPCRRCHVPHVVIQPYADHSAAERSHLYITCQGQPYFVGIAPSRVEREPGEEG